MKYTPYSKEELLLKQRYYKNLSEKQRRHFLALEYNSLGRGSQRYIAEVFGCCRKTIIKGNKELLDSASTALDSKRQRKPGGGRKKKKIR